MDEVIWVTLKIVWYSMLTYGFVLYISDSTEKDRTIPAIIIAITIALLFFWANLR